MALADIYQKATLVQIPSGYKSGTLYSVVPNTAVGDFTVTGDAEGEATRVNKDALIETVAANVPRLDYNPTNPQDPTLLLEPLRENSLTYSELFSNSYWTKENSSIGTGIVSPMGDTDAQNVIENTSTSRHRIRALGSVTSGKTYSLSVWAKSTNRNLVINADVLFNARSGFNLSTGVVADTTSGSATITAFPNDWFLCTVTGAATSTQSQVFYLQMQTGTTDADYTGDGSSTLSLFGAQLEEGTYPSSYIPTSGSAVTRTQDRCISGGNDALFNDSEGVLFADLEALGDGTTARKISLSDGSTDFVSIEFTTVAGVIAFSAGSTNNTFFSSIAVSGQTPKNRNKIAIKYKSGNTDCFVNGTKVLTRTEAFTLSGLDRVNFENRATSGSQNMFAKIHQLMVFNEALTDAELTTLTT